MSHGRNWLGVWVGMVFAMQNLFGSEYLPSLTQDLSADLINLSRRPHTATRKDVQQSLEQLMIREVFLKNMLSNPELFKPEEKDSVLPASSPVYSEMLKTAFARELAERDTLHLTPFFKRIPVSPVTAQRAR